MEEQKKEYVGLTADELVSLGFVMEDGEGDGTYKWYYYSMDIGDFCLITDDSDNIKDGKFSVQIFDYQDFVFTEYTQLKNFINLLKQNKKNG